jgi:hypothetical protein
VKVRTFNSIQYSTPVLSEAEGFNFQYFKFVFGVILMAIFFISPLCFALDLPKTAKLLPPQTILLIDVDDYGRLKQQFDKTSMCGLYKDPLMAPFIEHVKSKWTESIKEMDENNILKTIIESDVKPQGRLAFAFVPDEQAKDVNEEPPLVLITQWGTNIDKIKEAVTKAVEKNTELGGHRLPAEDFRGVTIESAVDEDDTPFSYCFIDDCFITGIKSESVKFVIARLKGASAPSLADDPDYSATMNTLGPDGGITVYINIKQLIQMALEDDPQGYAQTMLTNLGLDNVRSFGVSAELGKGPREPYNIKALLKINGSKKGLCKILEAESEPLRLPSFVPAETYRLNVININAAKAYTEILSVMTAFGPGVASVLYTPLVPASPDGQPAVMLKEDIIDHLADPIIIAQYLKKPFSENQFPVEYIIAVATTNRSALEKSLAACHSRIIAADSPDARRELLGQTIYLIKPDRLPFFRGPGSLEPLARLDAPAPGEEQRRTIDVPILAFTVTDTHLICGTESSVEKAVRTIRSGESLADTPWFSRAKAVLPARTGMAGLIDAKAGIEFLWWLLKQSKKDPGSAGLAAPTASYIISDFDLDFTLLPDFEKVSTYFGLAASYIISRDDGFFIEVKGIDQP